MWVPFPVTRWEPPKEKTRQLEKWSSWWNRERKWKGERTPHETQRLLHDWNKLMLDEGGLPRRKSGPNSQMVLPRKLHWLVYKELHEEMGHLGADRVIDLARAQFYWPHMQRDVEWYISQKCMLVCQAKSTYIPNESTFATDHKNYSIPNGFPGLCSPRKEQRWLQVHIGYHGPFHPLCASICSS